ncbi:MAG TPA: glycosyltransferase [Solirubrobacteraceae bacterium]|jgi:glycosyltransferase involved in cell wall biosynthesis
MRSPADDAPPVQSSSDADLRIRGRDIVCVGFADWESEVWTNQQHLMSRLARENRVLFVESLGLRRPQLAVRDVRRMARRLARGVAPPRERDGVWVLSPLVAPLHGSAAVRRLNRLLLAWLVRRTVRRLGMHDVILWGYVPQAEVLLDALEPALVVYHCVDDIAAQKGIDGESFRAAETRFAARADLVLASAPELTRRMRLLAGNVLAAPNVADTELFATALDPGPVDPALQALAHPRIVFTGAVVATKLDFDLLVALARARPSWSIALVGPVGPGDPRTDVSRLAAEPNVHLLGPRSYGELPAVLRGADAAIIPYACNELTASVFPMKVYEYLAAGLPVLSTPLPALVGVRDVHIAADGEEMARALGELLAQDSPPLAAERSRRAAGHSWDARLREIATALQTVPFAR